ncbi:phosphatidylethanolamine-binding protein [Thiocapsa imhoffii]|uniref:Phosphatidylethanolamine-binding protein n=1 Tax=Thiocapsa imhoffii TaxID=382777 RepID=A0A9X1BA06_9GAMM|nr:YbhB/YbcL family Raf kinase inhibitor-like protein [Thiocapsa imhoffii]MBK1645620.1 phosphatidylethanolamine-binding protein [Thiocapsa imhoffii]
MAMVLMSQAFVDGGAIPTRYTCEGEDCSPPLSWAGLPEGTASLVLIIDDPDAPDPAAPRMVWNHWILYNLPPTADLVAGAATSGLPPGVGEGINSWGRIGYGGPCPPIGCHRYFHCLYALDVILPSELGTPTRDELLIAMEDHIIGRTELVGTYEKASI